VLLSLANPRKLKHEPKATASKVDSLLPNRAKLRIDRELPIFECSITLIFNIEPRANKPWTLQPEPILAKCRTLQDEPMWTKFSTLAAEPIRLNERIDNEEPRCM
jgi:hypothetical protein